MTPDPYDVLHFAKKLKFESQMRGERNESALALIGVCTILIGASMLSKSMGRGR